MANIQILKNKIPFIITLFCCVTVASLAASVRAGDEARVKAAAAETVTRQVIVLDAGHGGLDSGCVAVNGSYEKDINLDIVKDLGALLTFAGYDVVYTRTDDVSIHDSGVEGVRNQKISDMENRLEIVKSYPDCVFISVHQNRFTDPAYFGGQMFYTTNNSENFRLARIMQGRFAALHKFAVGHRVHALKHTVDPEQSLYPIKTVGGSHSFPETAAVAVVEQFHGAFLEGNSSGRRQFLVYPVPFGEYNTVGIETGETQSDVCGSTTAFPRPYSSIVMTMPVIHVCRVM